jgi:hypothetical protein
MSSSRSASPIGPRTSREPRRGKIWRGYTPGQPDDPHQPPFLLILSLDVRNAIAP